MDDPGPECIGDGNAVAAYDVGDCVKSWGRRGILGGGVFGFALGVAFVAIPHTDNVLTFGVLGTLIVGVVEGAVVAGSFAACAAALYGKGVLRSSNTKIDRTLFPRRRLPEAGWREGGIPLSDWPTRWPHHDPAVTLPLLEATEEANRTTHSLLNARAQLNTIDAWENGNAGP